jgi:pullulanase
MGAIFTQQPEIYNIQLITHHSSFITSIIKTMSKFIMSFLATTMITFNGLTQELTIALPASYPVYAGTDLGCTYTNVKTTIRIYAPTAEAVQLHLYKAGIGENLIKALPFLKDINGTWKIELPGNNSGLFYTVQTRTNGAWRQETTDPYAKAVGVNGDRAQIVDLTTTNPAGWEKDLSPQFTNDNAMQDAVLYELHVRDASIHESSGIKHKGKFLGLAEMNTKNDHGQSTGLQHIKELGVTHIHLLPIFDFNSIDETIKDNPKYNWGYDPKNYNTPEGTYSSDAYEPSVRIKECKQMIAAIHKAGLGVVMDVVYNHTSLSEGSNFHQLVPGYYHRMKKNGSFADASACGNETASEKPMMRKFMTESLLYWVKEYHIDGFRFDLMGIHDIETMNEIASALRKIKPDILLYGEGWAASSPMLEKEKLASKINVSELDKIAVFSDDIRDGIKGYVFEDSATGFVNGNTTLTETVKFGIVGAMSHPQVDMQKSMYVKTPYASQPGQVINYADCHDNLILWDKLNVSAIHASREQKVRMHQMALGLVLTSQGIPFIHAGTEFLRTKHGVENSFKSPDSINAIDWNLKYANQDTYAFVQSLIQLRKSHPLFRLRTHDAVVEQITFLKLPEGIIAYTIDRKTENDSWKKVLVICNGLTGNQPIVLPGGEWKLALSNAASPNTVSGNIQAESLSFSILYQE